jgi:hypothetical protein
MPPRIFISAVSGELRDERELVAHTLRHAALGYDPVLQDEFSTEQGDLRAMLRRKIDGCFGVVQLVGRSYGAEPPAPDKLFGRVSYTHYEAQYGLLKKKRVWYFLLDESFSDGASTEPEDRRRLQEAYRARIKGGDHVYHVAAGRKELENSVLKLRADFEQALKARRRWYAAAGFALLLLLFLSSWTFYALVLNPSKAEDPSALPSEPTRSATAGRWARDAFVAVRVPHALSGTLLGDEPYKIPLEIRNPTALPLRISRLVVVSRNADAAALLDAKDDVVFKAEHHVFREIPPQATETVDVALNQALPKALTVRVHHNRWNEPSEFSLDVGGASMPESPPRYLSREQVFSGCDSLRALREATGVATAWATDAKLVAAFPANSGVSVDRESGLTFHTVDSWVATFGSFDRGRGYAVVVGSQGVASKQEIDAFPEMKERKAARAPALALGYQDAVDVANRSSLLCAAWENPTLGVVSIDGTWTIVWRLPYRGPDGLPLVIDGTSGDRIAGVGAASKRIKLAPAEVR